jgi:multiple sugar transport system permease protein
MVAPFLWMLTTSLKSLAEASFFPPRVLPSDPRWSNYADVFVKVPFARMILNTVFVSVAGVVGQLVTTSMAAFAFSRLRFRGRDALFVALLATMMVPHHVTLVPQYLLFKAFGWINTYYALVAPSWLGGAFGTFLLRQYFLGIPQELHDAARVDGCSPPRIYAQIVLPLSGHALAALGLLTFMARWNDLLHPLLYMNKPEMMTVTVGITYFVGQYYTDIPMVMATSVVSMLPTVAAFLFAQRYFVQGVVLSGIKG